MHFPTDDGLVKSVDGLSFGWSGARPSASWASPAPAKSVTSLGIMGLHNSASNARRCPARSGWTAQELRLAPTPDDGAQAARQRMAMIFQDPLSAMHPYYTVGDQIIEAYRVHNDVDQEGGPRSTRSRCSTGSASRSRDRRVDDYPHQFSGGMRQRAMIAMALAYDPELLIADEPTTALDVTVQAQILDLIRDLQKEFDSAVIIITHDLGVVAELADDILVMYGGRASSTAAPSRCSTSPQHPYTWGLLGSMPRLDRTPTERLIPIKGTPPSLINVPSGCAFHPRCPYARRTGRAQRARSVPSSPRPAERAPGRLPPVHARAAADLDRGDRARSCDRHETRPSRTHDRRPDARTGPASRDRC